MKLQLTMMKKDGGEVYTGVEVIVGPGTASFHDDLVVMEQFLLRMREAMNMIRWQADRLPAGLGTNPFTDAVAGRAVAIPFLVTEVQIVEVK